MSRRHPPILNASVDESIWRIMQFLYVRRDANGERLTYKIGKPEKKEDGWFKCDWLNFDPGALENSGLWKAAYHGSKMEALYSIMFQGRLKPSLDNIKQDVRAVYCHDEETREKSYGYARFMPLFGDGVMWQVVWQVRVDRNRAVKLSRGRRKDTDQWAQEPSSVHLEAVWFHGVLHENMVNNSEFSEIWNPMIEAHPLD